MPFRKAGIDKVLSRLGTVEENPEVKAVLCLFKSGVGEEKDQGQKGDDPQWSPELEVGPEPSREKEDPEEEEPLWSFEGHFRRKRTEGYGLRRGAACECEGEEIRGRISTTACCLSAAGNG